MNTNRREWGKRPKGARKGFGVKIRGKLQGALLRSLPHSQLTTNFSFGFISHLCGEPTQDEEQHIARRLHGVHGSELRTRNREPRTKNLEHISLPRYRPRPQRVKIGAGGDAEGTEDGGRRSAVSRTARAVAELQSGQQQSGG
jgi:hypothetical protein